MSSSAVSVDVSAADIAAVTAPITSVALSEAEQQQVISELE